MSDLTCPYVHSIATAPTHVLKTPKSECPWNGFNASLWIFYLQLVIAEIPQKHHLQSIATFLSIFSSSRIAHSRSQSTIIIT